MSKYTCTLCQKAFGQKIDFTRHTKNKKTPCVSLEKIQEIQQLEQTAKKSEKTRDDKIKELKQQLDNCHNLLRDREGITGEKALRNIGFVVILKMLERFINQGDPMGLLTHNYDFSEYDMPEEDQREIVSYVRFSVLKGVNEEKFVNNVGLFWDIILAQNPFTKKIFRKGKEFDIRKGTTFVALFKIIDELDTDDEMGDLLGDAYELFIKDIMKGKTLGQFFTPLQVRRKLVKLMCPQVRPDGTIPSCCDPTMGTGGLLLTYLNSLKTDANSRGITLDWNQIQHAIYGRELEPDTFQLGMSNMLVSTGYIFDDFECGDSIRDPINRKFDYIIANPPFGIKGLKYDEIPNYSGLKGAYIPIKTNNAVSLFLQAIIYMLNIGGTCAVVLPDGQDLFSKSGAYVQVREYLMKTCDLKGVYYLPAGIFEHTPIKTCIFHFVKRREGNDILVQPEEEPAEIGGKKKKAKKVKTDTIFSTKTHQTTKVRFYDHTPGSKNDHESEGTDSLFAEVSIEDIAANSYSLNYTEYIKEEGNEEQEAIDERNGVVVKTLGEVCKFDIGGTPLRNNSQYYDNGNNLWVSVRELNGGYIYDTKEKITDLGVKNSSVKLFDVGTVLFSFKLSIGKTAMVGTPLYTNEAIAGVVSKDTSVLTNKYLYYYLTITDFTKMGAGILGNGSLNKKSLAQLKIPIPSLERQQEIIEYLDFIYENANKTNAEKIAELKQLNAFRLKHQQTFGVNVVKTLGEVCQIDYGTRIVRKRNENGEYPVYGSGRATFTTNTYNRENYTILVGRFALSVECVRLTNERLFLNDSGLSVTPRETNLMHKYLGYYLFLNQQLIYDCARGTAQKNLEISAFKYLKIPIPSLERQQEIVAYCEQNDERIKQLEQEIEQNKQLAAAFIADALSSNGTSYSISDESEHDNDNETEEPNEEDAEYEEEESA